MGDTVGETVRDTHSARHRKRAHLAQQEAQLRRRQLLVVHGGGGVGEQLAVVQRAVHEVLRVRPQRSQRAAEQNHTRRRSTCLRACGHAPPRKLLAAPSERR